MPTSIDISATGSSAAAHANGRANQTEGVLSQRMRVKSFWRDTAPKGIVGNDTLATWQRHLTKRRAPVPLDMLASASETPLRWGLSLRELSPKTVELLALADQLGQRSKANKSGLHAELVEQVLGGWLESAQASSASIDFALECLAIANLLPAAANQISPEFWWEVADALWKIATDGEDWHTDAELPPEQGVAQQLLAGELPLTLAYLFPEMRPLGKLRTSAQAVLTEGITELANGNGLVHGAYLGFQRPLLACWTRCRLMGTQLKKGCWRRKADEQFQWMVTHALGTSSATGTPLLGGAHDEAWSADFLRTALSLAGDASDVEAAKSFLSKRLVRDVKLKADGSVPETSSNCEWAGVAYMRTDWERSAPVLAIDYSTQDLKLECWSGTQRLLDGVWTWETTLDGKRLEPVGTWDETCWFSDDDVDYLELSMELTDGARLERQILLARDELFLLLCDYVIDTAGGKLCHRYRLPLTGDVEFEPEAETREGVLRSGKVLGRVLPLALPEWRADPRIGQLSSNNNRLQLEQEREGQNMASPLLIDLNRSRAKKQCTWRQLTVAQALEVQPHDVAVGYRAQCGKDQWLIYRSLVDPANRTVLGQNLSNECLVARFLAPEGEVDELLEIE
ncbi:MAG: hypothetical protein AAGD11_02750 [Planctomycetota bacterium]